MSAGRLRFRRPSGEVELSCTNSQRWMGADLAAVPAPPPRRMLQRASEKPADAISAARLDLAAPGRRLSVSSWRCARHQPPEGQAPPRRGAARTSRRGRFWRLARRHPRLADRTRLGGLLACPWASGSPWSFMEVEGCGRAATSPRPSLFPTAEPGLHRLHTPRAAGAPSLSCALRFAARWERLRHMENTRGNPHHAAPQGLRSMTDPWRCCKEVLMPDARMTRRLAGMLATRLQEAQFDQVPDGRDDRGQRWSLETLLVTVLTAMAAGARSLAEAERVTASLSRAARRWLGIQRRVPDTTLRDAPCTVQPRHLAPCLHSLVLAAHRRKALQPETLPFGVASLDGKSFSLPSCDDGYAQRQSQAEGLPLVGLLRTITTTLTSSPARPCIDVTPLPATTPTRVPPMHSPSCAGSPTPCSRCSAASPSAPSCVVPCLGSTCCRTSSLPWLPSPPNIWRVYAAEDCCLSEPERTAPKLRADARALATYRPRCRT
jgi:hypothetical protein